MAKEKEHHQLRTLKKKIFLLYPYYWPHYKAGGPVQSLYNLCAFFKSDFSFYLVSLDRDMDGSEPSSEVHGDAWNTGPHGEQVFYSSRISWQLVKKLINEIRPDVVFINGIFNINTTLPALFYGKRIKSRIVISPRGMLQAWGLQRNKWVKKLFLILLRICLKKQESWHATDQQEKKDIHQYFGSKQVVFIASNIPRSLSSSHSVSFRDDRGKIKLVFLSLINPNKNLHLVIEAVNGYSSDFSLDIYGPVIDKGYWAMCEAKIAGSSAITYKGSILPWTVPSVIQYYHFFILPTQGENFGHAIFDALSAGVPVAISKNTPWLEIDNMGAGYYFETISAPAIAAVLEKMVRLTPESYHHFRINSWKFASDYLNQKDYREEYAFLLD